MLPNQSLKLIPTVKRRPRLEPAVGEFAARQYLGNDMISRNVRAMNYNQNAARRRGLPVPLILVGAPVPSTAIVFGRHAGGAIQVRDIHQSFKVNYGVKRKFY